MNIAEKWRRELKRTHLRYFVLIKKIQTSFTAGKETIRCKDRKVLCDKENIKNRWKKDTKEFNATTNILQP